MEGIDNMFTKEQIDFMKAQGIVIDFSHELKDLFCIFFKKTLIQAMIVMGVSMGAFIGLPPSLIETYSGDIKKMYQANGVPLYLGLVTMFISSLVHLTIMSSIIVVLSPVLFDAELPKNLPLFYGALIIFIAVSLSLGSILGLSVKNQAKLTMPTGMANMR